MLMNYHIGRLVLSSLCVGVFAAAPEDGYINVRNMLSAQ